MWSDSYREKTIKTNIPTTGSCLCRNSTWRNTARLYTLVLSTMASSFFERQKIYNDTCPHYLSTAFHRSYCSRCSFNFVNEMHLTNTVDGARNRIQRSPKNEEQRHESVGQMIISHFLIVLFFFFFFFHVFSNHWILSISLFIYISYNEKSDWSLFFVKENK